MTTPSELLSQAADLIRDAGAKATDGPWEIEYDYTGKTPQAIFRMDPNHPEDPDYSIGLGAMDLPADNRWVALVNPEIAGPIEAWLRYEAAEAPHWTDDQLALPDCAGHVAARAFAKALLGTPEETP